MVWCGGARQGAEEWDGSSSCPGLGWIEKKKGGGGGGGVCGQDQDMRNW